MFNENIEVGIDEAGRGCLFDYIIAYITYKF